MSYDKSVLKKEQKGLLKCALDQRGPSNVPKEKKMVPKNFKVRQKKPSNKFLKCAQGKKKMFPKVLKCVQKIFK
jgi:hypothetical protein